MGALQALGHRFKSDYLHKFFCIIIKYIYSFFKTLMKYIILKDRRRRILAFLYERRANVLRSRVENQILSPTIRVSAFKALHTLPRDSSFLRIRNRCSLTGRSRAIYRKFGISRLRFRKLASFGLLYGVKKAS